RAAAAAGHSLLTELQTEHVDVTMTFTGSDTLIYGALSRPGDVIIKVTSPNISVDLTHKKAIGPFWLDSGKLTVRHTPGLYYLMSSRPINKLLPARDQLKYGLHLQDALKQAQVDAAAARAMGNWQKAFLDLKQDTGLFRELPHAVKLVEKRLFSATIELPANIPLGTYHLDIYLVQNGRIISHQTRNLEVNQVQLEHWVANAVNQHSWLFGIAFTIFALFLGLTLGMALRRGSDS
ncbi:MAG: TIGR02186 family protein, partial [Gammaproteobacteria bacterium]